MPLKCSFALIALLIGFSSQLSAQNKDSTAIMKLLKDDYVTLVTLDKAAHTRNVTSDYLLLENGQVWPLQTELDSFYAGKPDKNKSRNDFFTVKQFSISGNMAYVVWHLRSEYLTNGKLVKEKVWNESGVFRKENGEWKMALLHSSVAIQ